MDHISDWKLFNQKHKLAAEEYVKINLLRLINLFKLDTSIPEEDMKDILIQYFTKHPDQIKSITYSTVGKPNGISIPRTNNIGGVY